jgi:hypothetical protein
MTRIWTPLPDGIEWFGDGTYYMTASLSGSLISMGIEEDLQRTEYSIQLDPNKYRLCQATEDAAPVPLDMPDGEVRDYLVRLVLAEENAMLTLVKRYNFEESSLRFETCRKALEWLDTQPWQAQPSEEDK